MPESGHIAASKMNGSNQMTLRFMQVIIDKERDSVDKNVTLTKLQLPAKQDLLLN